MLVEEAPRADGPRPGRVLAVEDRDEAGQQVLDVVFEDYIRQRQPGLRAEVARIVGDLDGDRPAVEQGRVLGRQPGQRIDGENRKEIAGRRGDLDRRGIGSALHDDGRVGREGRDDLWQKWNGKGRIVNAGLEGRGGWQDRNDWRLRPQKAGTRTQCAKQSEQDDRAREHWSAAGHPADCTKAPYGRPISKLIK
jgi:hypothetical protein